MNSASGHAAIDDADARELDESLDQIVNRLWTGNSAGVVTALSAIGSGKVAFVQILPALFVFVLGIAALGLGACVALATRLRRLDGGASTLSSRAPMRLAFLSAAMFVAGMAWAIGLTIFILLAK